MIKPYGRNMWIEPVVKSQVLVADKVSLCEYGEVMAIGKDVKDTKVGDMVGFKVWGVTELEVDGKKYFFVPESDDFLLGTIEND